MLALLLAAQVAAAAPAIVSTEVYRAPPAAKTRETPNMLSIPEFCRKLTQQTVRPIPPRGTMAPSPKLGDMPPAYMEYAIDTRVAGCPIPTYVTFGGQPIRSR